MGPPRGVRTSARGATARPAAARGAPEPDLRGARGGAGFGPGAGGFDSGGGFDGGRSAVAATLALAPVPAAAAAAAEATRPWRGNDVQEVQGVQGGADGAEGAGGCRWRERPGLLTYSVVVLCVDTTASTPSTLR